jgi:hypothetical protein
MTLYNAMKSFEEKSLSMESCFHHNFSKKKVFFDSRFLIILDKSDSRKAQSSSRIAIRDTLNGTLILLAFRQNKIYLILSSAKVLPYGIQNGGQPTMNEKMAPPFL